MRQLAARIFGAFFAALLLTAFGAIGLTSWVLADRQKMADAELLEAAQAAAAALASADRDGLLAWAKNRSAENRHQLEILVVDETGVDVLGRLVPGSEAVTPSASTEEDWEYDFPAVMLSLPTATPLLYAADGEPFRLLPVPRRAGLAAWRDVPLQLMMLALIVTGLVSLLLARSITRPILALERTTESLAGGTLEARVPSTARDRSDEIGRLARSLDTMAERLGSLIRGQRQLLRDVSHEVRSPLARIRLASGLMVQRDPAASAAAARIDDEVTRLDELIDKILDVSRLESGSISWQREPLELRSLVEGLVIDAAFEASQIGKSLESRLVDAPLPIIGDKYWVLAAIENIVRNALRHTPEASRVTIDLQQLDDEKTNFATLSVSDTGRGLSEEELKRIFEPFFRGSTDGDGHAASPRAAGSGLGLAIAARVVQAHGGRIEAKNLRGDDGAVQGLQVILTWPLADTPHRGFRAASEP